MSKVRILAIMALVSITIPKKVMGVLGMTILNALTRALMHWRSERIRGTDSQKVVYVVNKSLNTYITKIFGDPFNLVVWRTSLLLLN